MTDLRVRLRNWWAKNSGLNSKKAKLFFLANKSFDRDIKKSFRGEVDEEHFVSFPTAKLKDDPDRGLEANIWRMTEYGNPD